MPATSNADPKPDYRDDDTGEPKPPAPLAWEPPGGLIRRNLYRGRNLGKRRPR